MFQCFLEIGYEAELNTKENPELMEIAYGQCKENVATRTTFVTELRKMIFDRGECQPLRTDDEYLLRFLRARNFIVPRAHRLLVHYCNFREQYKHLYEGVDLWGLTKVKDAIEGTLIDRPDIGRLSIFRFGRWDPSEFPMEELIQAGTVMVEIGVRQPKLQILGGTAIVDLEGVTLKHVAALTPTVAYQIVCLLGLAVPVRVKGIHIINYSWIFNTFFYLFKRFIPQQAWEKIHFHSNLKSLQQYIDLECLPPRYGGICRAGASFGVWLKKIKKYRNEQFDTEMKQLGYVIKE